MQENLPEDDIPPSWMWPFDKAMEKWFKTMKERAGKPVEEDEPGKEWGDNDYAKGMRD